MKNLLVIFYVLLLVPVIAFGQEQKQEQESAGQGYLFAAPGGILSNGGITGTLHFGGGGEFNIYKGLGIGAEIGYLSPTRAMGCGIGVLSLNGLYSFRTDRRSKVVPFVTGGYSLLFRSGYANAFNVGGGLNYWFSDKAGLRFEFRDHISPNYWDAHAVQARIGITFR
jgi:hypothetical protein